MILSFGTEGSGQTVQTQIRLLLEEHSDQGLQANSADPDQTALGRAFWSGSSLFAIPSTSMGDISQLYSQFLRIFRVITATFLGVWKFRTFTVYSFDKACWSQDVRSIWCMYKQNSWQCGMILHIWFVKEWDQLSRDVSKPVFRDSDQVTNRAGQSLKMARDLKFRILEVEGLCYLVAKTKTLISFAVTAKLICFFVFAYAKIRFSHVAAQL